MIPAHVVNTILKKNSVNAGLTANTETWELTVFLCSTHGNPTMRGPPPHHVPLTSHLCVSRQDQARPRLACLEGRRLHQPTYTLRFALGLLLGKTVNMARLPLSLPLPLTSFHLLCSPPPPHGTLPVNSERCQLRRQSFPDLWPFDTLLIWTPWFVHGWKGTWCIPMTLLHSWKACVTYYESTLKHKSNSYFTGSYL